MICFGAPEDEPEIMVLEEKVAGPSLFCSVDLNLTKPVFNPFLT